VIQRALNAGVENFIYSSSAAVYGAPGLEPVTESAPFAPQSPYGTSKLMTEWMLRDVAAVNPGFRYAALRYFNVAGADPQMRAGQSSGPSTHLIKIAAEAATGKRDGLRIFGDDFETPDGTCVRDYIHVLDLAEAHLLALDALERGSCTYNLGNGQGYSVQQMIDLAREITGHPIPVEMQARRPGDPAVLIADATAARRELGWQPRHSDLRAIVESAWRWHQAHPHGYGG
jgi:UDP-glucose 4-epimerase